MAEHDPVAEAKASTPPYLCPNCGTQTASSKSNCEKCWRPLPIGLHPHNTASSASTPAQAKSVPKDDPATSSRLESAGSSFGSGGRQRNQQTASAKRKQVDTSRISALTALLIVLGSLAVLWIIQVINNADMYRLSIDYSIQPRMVAKLPEILSAPFLHWSWSHIESNSIPFLVLGFLAAYRSSLAKFLSVSAVVVLTSGLAVWLTASTGSEVVGASGVIFGWFGYVMVRGFFAHSTVDIVIGVMVMIYYLPVFGLLFPAPHLAYQDHIGGLIGGVFCGWAFRPRSSEPRATASVR